jgi:hypothetical protein
VAAQGVVEQRGEIALAMKAPRRDQCDRRSRSVDVV